MLGRIIERLPEEAKDRIVRAQNWTTGVYERAFLKGAELQYKRCFVGHVFDGVPKENEVASLHKMGRVDKPFSDCVGRRFDKLVARFGKDRIVRAIKKRAGADLDIGDVADVDVTEIREPATATA